MCRRLYDREQKTTAFRKAESSIPQRGMFNSVERNATMLTATAMKVPRMPRSQTIRGLERGLQVLQVLQSNPISSLHDVHVATKISKPSLLRILHTLERSGLVSRRLGDGRYRVSANLTRVARRRAGYDRIAESAAPVLDRLCKQILWPSDLLVPAGDHMEIVETSQTHSPFLIKVSGIGQPVNWLLSAVGRVYLAFCADRERDAILQRLRKSDNPVDRLARDPRRLDRILEETRQRGYGTRDPAFGGGAYGHPPVDDGLASIAVPLLERARVHGAVNILWIKTAFTIDEFAARHLADLQAAAAEIAASLRTGTKNERRR
jgi:IclR family transcriptional regulator, mhp operon transcriptional activator